MNTLEKFQYLGLAQSIRKVCLKTERAAKRFWLRAPTPPKSDPALDFSIDLLGHTFDLSQPHRWHRSPDAGQDWPLLYSQAIPLDAAGDVKLIWELNRLQFLPALAASDPELVRRILRDWVAQNPYEFGINWYSALEVGLRLIAMVETLSAAQQLRPEFSHTLEQHARFIRHNIGTDWIPRGNHLIGEAAALAIYNGPNPWLAAAAREQFFASGVHREQSVAYHHFVTHLLSRAELPQPKALAYLAAIRQPDGSLPNLGDNDDGLASMQPFPLADAPATSTAFPDAGHYVMRHNGDYCFIRCGEFGLGPNFAHAHADLLSPILWLGNTPVFVDAGTFTYNGDAAMRRHFRSAHAHNVLVLDDQDQAEQTGTFSWQKPPVAICEDWNDSTFIGRLGPWRRRIQHIAPGFAFQDTIEGNTRRRLRWRFHLAPGLKIDRIEDGVFTISNQFALHVKAPPNTLLQKAKGWHSASYNHRVPIQICEISLDATLPVTAGFVIQ